MKKPSDAEVRDMEAAIDAIVEQIRPLLAGKPAPLQGYVCAELTAIWLAGHHPDFRENLLRSQEIAVRELVAFWHERLRRGK